MSINVLTDYEPANISKNYRFTIFESHTETLTSIKDYFKYGLSIIRPHTNRKSNIIATSSIDALKDHEALTITYDNGKEFAKHDEISEALNVDIYFAKPYASWQRGTNENMNGLIRQYLPKSVPLDAVSIEQTQFIEHRLNNRPRKVFGFQTPLEVLSRC